MKNITPAESIVPVYLIPLTPEEEAERKQLAKEKKAEEKTVKAKESARKSALEKLVKLGLSEEEILALIG
jgi:hypothetical protein